MVTFPYLFDFKIKFKKIHSLFYSANFDDLPVTFQEIFNNTLNFSRCKKMSWYIKLPSDKEKGSEKHMDRLKDGLVKLQTDKQTDIRPIEDRNRGR